MKHGLCLLAACLALPAFAEPRPATELETSIVMEVQTAFLVARENGDAAARWGLLGPVLQGQISPDEMGTMIANEQSQYGALENFNPAIITAYPEQNAIVIDFVSTYENDFYECGYVVWTEVDAGIRLTRFERSFLPFDAREDLSDEELFEATQCRTLPVRRDN